MTLKTDEDSEMVSENGVPVPVDARAYTRACYASLALNLLERARGKYVGRANHFFSVIVTTF